MLSIQDLQKKVSNGRARLDIATDSLAKKRKSLDASTVTLDKQKKALALLQDVASKTQDQLKDAV